MGTKISARCGRSSSQMCQTDLLYKDDLKVTRKDIHKQYLKKTTYDFYNTKNVATAALIHNTTPTKVWQMVMFLECGNTTDHKKSRQYIYTKFSGGT